MTIKIKSKITAPHRRKFQTEESGLVAISVSARCKSAKQIKSNTDEDLRVEINSVGFREIPARKNTQQYNIPPSFNGSQLKGLKKTVVFFVMLKKGENVIDLIPRPSAFIEEIIIKELGGQRSIALPVNEQAEDGDRRPWFAFVLAYASLKSFSISAAIQYRISDSDDVKVIIDNNIQKQEYSHYHRFWVFAGNLFKKLKQEKERQEKTFTPNLPKGRHYIEIWADKTPTLGNIALEIDPEFAPDDRPTKRIPTVDDPKWAGNFNDDTEQMILARLIFGEARSQPREAKEWIAWSVINRTEAESWWPGTVHGVILQEGQYDPFKTHDPNYEIIIDPLNGADTLTREKWRESYQIAGDVISGKTESPTPATHFHGIGVTRDWFEKHNVPEGEFLKKIGDTYFYQSPN